MKKQRRERVGDGRTYWWRSAIALIAFTALIAASCGDSGGGTAASTTSDGRGAASTTVAGQKGDALAPQPLPKKTKIRIAWPVGVEAFGSVIVADALGEFEKENLEAQFIVAPPSEAIALLQTDRADVWVSSVNAALFNAVNSGIDLRWVAPTFYPNPQSLSGLWLNSKLYDANGKVNVAALKGKTIGLGSGGAGAVTTPLIDEWLRGLGLTMKDIKIDSSLNGAEILIGLENGALDGGWLSDPVWVNAQQSGIAKPVVTQAGQFGSYALSGYVMHGRSFEESNKATTQAFLRALARANRDHLQGDYHKDDAVVSAISKAAGTPKDKITSSLPLRFDSTLVIDPKVVDVLQASWLGIGGILQYQKAIPGTKLIDQSLLPSTP
jgi:NitT/TauT family transport system substrate-binding protein